MCLLLPCPDLLLSSSDNAPLTFHFNLHPLPLLFSSRYQSSQQHPEAQYGMPYHNMGHYTEGPRDEPVMAELSVHREQPHYPEPFNQNYPQAPNHYQDQVYQQPAYQQNYREQQHPAHLHHPQHQHTVQQQEANVQHQPQPAGAPQGTVEIIDQCNSPLHPKHFILSHLID